jgi:hypothetical protein
MIRFTGLIGGGTAVAVALVIVTAAPANAAKKYAAIAASTATGAWGWAILANSKQEAKDLAAGFCAGAGGTNCQTFAAGEAGECAALVTNDKSLAGGLGVSEAAAEGNALGKFGGGRVLVSVCPGSSGNPMGRGGAMKLPSPPPPPAPAPAPAPQVLTATVTGDVDVYDAPGGTGKVLGILQKDKQVQLATPCRADNWCEVRGIGWVWGDFLKQ